MRCCTNVQWNQVQIKDRHSRCETIADIFHSIIVSPYISGIWQEQDSSISPYGKCLDLYPYLVGKCEHFLFFRQSKIWSLIWYWLNSISSKLSPKQFMQSECYCKYTAIIYPTLLLNWWNIHHKMGATSSPSSLLMIKNR